MILFRFYSYFLKKSPVLTSKNRRVWEGGRKRENQNGNFSGWNRASTNSCPSSATRRFSLPLSSSNFVPRLSPTSHPPPLRYQLFLPSSLSLYLHLCDLNYDWFVKVKAGPKRSEFPSTRPLSASLVSKLSTEATTSSQGKLSGRVCFIVTYRL